MFREGCQHLGGLDRRSTEVEEQGPRMSFVRRYTNLAGVIHILVSRKITLLNPDNWDDGNDRYFMEKYSLATGAKSVSALCFSQSSETYHHWRVFAPGSDGVCIDFKKSELQSTFASDPEVKAQSVRYEKIDALSISGVPASDLPFVKRLPYKDENEWRVVNTSMVRPRDYPDYDIKLAWINNVYLSPWMPKPLVVSVKKTLRGIPGCSKLNVFQTTLLDNQKWKRVADKSSS